MSNYCQAHFAVKNERGDCNYCALEAKWKEKIRVATVAIEKAIHKFDEIGKRQHSGEGRPDCCAYVGRGRDLLREAIAALGEE